MCDNLGISEQKVKAWKLSAGDYSGIIFTDYKDIIAWIESEIEIFCDGDSLTYTIEFCYMTESEIEALPELG